MKYWPAERVELPREDGITLAVQVKNKTGAAKDLVGRKGKGQSGILGRWIWPVSAKPEDNGSERKGSVSREKSVSQWNLSLSLPFPIYRYF